MDINIKQVYCIKYRARSYKKKKKKKKKKKYICNITAHIYMQKSPRKKESKTRDLKEKQFNVTKKFRLYGKQQ